MSTSVEHVPSSTSSPRQASAHSAPRKRRSRSRQRGARHTKAEYERGQMEAMQALIGDIGLGLPIGQLTLELLAPTMSRDGKQPFSKDLLSGTLTDVLEKSMLVPKSMEGREHLRREEAAKLVDMMTDINSAGANAGYIIEVAQHLQHKTQVTTAETFGQCLWRHRERESLKRQPHCYIVEDLQWIEDPGEAPAIVDMCTTVFRELTYDKGGQMSPSLWSKAIELMRGNPILRERCAKNDSDRFFYAEAMREVRKRSGKFDSSNDTGGFSIGLARFLGLLVDMSSFMKVHPFMVFLAVGCHAKILVAHRSEREASAAASRASSAVSSRPSARPPIRARTPDVRQVEQRPSRRGA